MYKIDEEKFAKKILQFKNYVVCKQYTDTRKKYIEYVSKNGINPTKVEFDKGWLDFEEGYKHRFLADASKKLQIECWNEDNLLDMEIPQRVLACMDIQMDPYPDKSNLLYYLDKADCHDFFKEDSKTATDVIYQIICGDNDRQAFEDAVSFFGKRYPIISYIFFLKNIRKADTYVPVRPDNMKAKFELLGIPGDCLHSATWENYHEYCEIMKTIENRLKHDFDKVDIIDAHSFVWVADQVAEYGDTFRKIDQETEKLEILGSEREIICKARVNQTAYRNVLRQRYHDRCCLCNVDAPEFLVASHIQPWCSSSEQERVDVDNGFLLCPNHDRLFDQGWISFSDDGKIMISDELSTNNQIFMNVHQDMYIELTDGNRKYLKFHRENIFRGKK